MTAIWTLRDAEGVEKTAAEWGLRELTRERTNQAVDVVTFRVEGPSDADAIFAQGSTVRLFRNGLPWFYGRVVQAPGRASPQSEEQLYRLAGPWWHLENLVFQQIWQTTNGTDTTLVATNSSRIIFGQKADGTKLMTGDAIREVLAYAIERGVPITVGEVTPDAVAPYAEGLDLSCAEVIKELLRWTPDAVAAFDYATEPFPTLSILRRTEAATVTLPAYGAPVSGLDLTPRHDLQVPAVVLKFEQTHDIDHDTFTSLTVQSAPETATGDELGAMVMTLELGGARATYHRHNVKTAVIPGDASAPGVLDWWRKKFAWLGEFDADDLEVVAESHTLAIENLEEHPGLILADVPNELLEGSLTSWMNLKAAVLRVRATLRYTGVATDASRAVWGADNERVLYTRVTGTNAQTQTYSRLTSATEAEPIPEGLAAALYAAASVLPYDGVLELTERECSSTVTPGALLNLTGGRAEWATMSAQIQRVEEQLHLGRTRMIVGPAKHLGHDDLAGLLRLNRRRRVTYRLNERTTGVARSRAAQVQGGEQMPRSDSIFRPSAGSVESTKPFQLLDVSDETGLKVVVYTNSFLQESLEVDETFAVSGLSVPIEVAVGTQVWLELEFEDYAVTSATIAFGASGWSGFPEPFAFDGTAPNQTLAKTFLLIGYVVEASSSLDGTSITGGPPESLVSAKLVQCVAQHLLLQNVVHNGLAAVFPFPHHAPYLT